MTDVERLGIRRGRGVGRLSQGVSVCSAVNRTPPMRNGLPMTQIQAAGMPDRALIESFHRQASHNDLVLGAKRYTRYPAVLFLAWAC